MIRVLGFDWDDGNRKKCQKHGISILQIEALFRQDGLFIGPTLKHTSREQRFYAAGKMPNGKPALVIFTYRGGYIRPISARYMHEKENQRYQKINSSASE